MIEKNELRLGNVVQDADDGELYIVTEISHTDVTCTQLEKAWMRVPAGYDSYNPVPLSPELLVQCGFVKSGAIWIHPTTMHYEIWNRAKLKGNYHFFAGRMQRRVFLGISDRIHYLHQLMNIHFALTGTELTINPPPEN